MIKGKDKGIWNLLMELFIMENFKMVYLMEKENIVIRIKGLLVNGMKGDL